MQAVPITVALGNRPEPENDPEVLLARQRTLTSRLLKALSAGDEIEAQALRRQRQRCHLQLSGLLVA